MEDVVQDYDGDEISIFGPPTTQEEYKEWLNQINNRDPRQTINGQLVVLEID